MSLSLPARFYGNWIDNLNQKVPMSLYVHLKMFGTFPRGHLDEASHCSKKTRDKRRTKNKLARQARKVNWT